MYVSKVVKQVYPPITCMFRYHFSPSIEIDNNLEASVGVYSVVSSELDENVLF